MSAEMGVCSVCELTKRLSLKGLVYTHPNPLLPGEECEGSRKPVKTIEVPEDVVLAAVEEFRASLRAPVKKTWRQRIKDRFKRIEKAWGDAHDVFDE